MRTQFVSLAIGALLLGTPVFSAEDGQHARFDTPDFGTAVRSYLLENPEVILEVFYLLEEKERAQKATSDQELIAELSGALFEDARDGRIGNPGGSQIFVEFIDYNCGYCRNNAEEIQAVLDKNPDVALILKEFPILGDASELAARTALAVKSIYGNEAYEMFHETLFASRGQTASPLLARVLDQLGFDAEKVNDFAGSDSISQHLADTRELAKSLGVSGTPGFVFPTAIHRGAIDRIKIANFLSVVSH